MSTVTLERQSATIPSATLPLLPVRSLKWWLAVLAAGLLTLSAAWYGEQWWTYGRFIETTDDAYAGGDVTQIAPHVAGFVGKILVADNQHVAAGDLLVRLDDRDFRAAADRAAAIVPQRQAAITGLQSRESLQQALIRQASADLAAKNAAAAFAHQENVRYSQLAASANGSRQNAERAAAQDQAALSTVLAAKAGLDAARQQLSVLDSQIAEAKAAVDEAEAELASARLALSYTEIHSPIEGYIGNRAAEVGAYVTSGSYLLTVIPARQLWIDANFKEDQLRHIQPGQAATIVADVLPDHVFTGRVLSLAPGTGAIFSVIPPENATGNFTKIVQRVPVRIALDLSDPLLMALRPGLSVTVNVDTRTNGSAQ
jgi:membrane fusion protein (multidrug efflux system)